MFIENAKFIYFTAFLTGILSGAHCVGMCGGIIFALSAILPKKSKKVMHLYYICYNLGRVIAYCFAGGIAGFLGFVILDITNGKIFLLIKVIGGISLLSVGLYLGGWLSLFNFLERIGLFFWSKVQPYLIKTLPIKNAYQAILIGILWGNIPCGLVYATLIWSLSFGSIIQSVILMMFFGAGTLPVMLLSLFFMSSFKVFFNNKNLRHIVCVVMVSFGTLSIINAIILNKCH